ncbi:C-factor [Cyphellophora attinorum]|uniref:C-factor n=1 Tax=Cyphellophora attinorum TaxID=1664694 RepID=A0A0N0NIE5_9EURO|nr:C-factor [Phialophora attinorum]KPI35648.1 C-factor [Phialophora attinorum]
MPTWVITGANRGLGLEFVRQLVASKEDNTVLALVRSLSKTDLSGLNAIKNDNVHIHECETSDEASITAFAESLKTSSSHPQINFLINNAAINAVSQKTALTLTGPEMHNHLDVNVLGPALLIQKLMPLLAPGAVILNMTSGLGSFGRALFGGATVYSASKAMLNMVSVHLAVEKAVVEKKIRVLIMDPGHVKTDMGGPRAVLEQEESIGGMLKVILEEAEGKGKGDVGKAVFRQYDGKVVPW